MQQQHEMRHGCPTGTSRSTSAGAAHSSVSADRIVLMASVADEQRLVCACIQCRARLTAPAGMAQYGACRQTVHDIRRADLGLYDPGMGVLLMPPVAHGCSTATVQQRGTVGCVKDALYCLAWTACCCCYSGEQYYLPHEAGIIHLLLTSSAGWHGHVAHDSQQQLQTQCSTRLKVAQKSPADVYRVVTELPAILTSFGSRSGTVYVAGRSQRRWWICTCCCCTPGHGT